MYSSMLNKAANFIWFQTIWFLVIFTQYEFIWVIGLLFIAFFLISPAKLRDGVLMLVIVMLGTLIDSGLTLANIFSFESAAYVVPIPLWLVALWGAFSLTLPYSLNYLQTKGWLCVLLGAVFGPISYWAGERFGAVIFPKSLWWTLFILAVVWATLFPLSMVIARYVETFFKDKSQPHFERQEKS